MIDTKTGVTEKMVLDELRKVLQAPMYHFMPWTRGGQAARSMLCYILHAHLGLSPKQVADYVGWRTHDSATRSYRMVVNNKCKHEAVGSGDEIKQFCDDLFYRLEKKHG